MKRVLLSLGVACSLASLAGAQTDDSYRHGYLRTVEAGVTLQRADEPSAEVAVANAPFLPGDRIWTDEAGRLEVQFADGTVLRLDSRSKLDYVSHEGGRRSERVILRLWSGSVYLHYRDSNRSPEFTIETPEAVFEPAERGAYRLDVSAGQARLLVFDGEGTLEAGRRAKVERGEQALVREGELAGEPQRFDGYDADDEFARWDQQQQEQLLYAEERQQDLPEEIVPYAADFGMYGTWDVHNEYGRVWYPRVATGWRPYSQGYWDWTPYGWTWIPNERWGWATSHYGRWGHGGGRGWYWIPGRSWGPGWVSWARGGDYVGWCPLGFGDRPVVIQERHPLRRIRGNAVPRGSRTADATTVSSPWFYVRRNDMGGRDLARRRVDPASVASADVRVAQTARQRLSRDLRIVEGGSAAAVPRHVSTRPGPGDTVPELRTDPMSTIRRAIPRRKRDPDEERPADPAAEGERSAPGVRTPRSPRPAQSPWSTDATAAPRQDRAPAQPDASHWSEREAARRATPRQRPEAERQDDQNRDREPLRPLFRGFSRPREENRSSGSSSDAGAARPRSEESRPAWTRPRREDASPRPRSEDSGASRPRSEGSGASRPRGGDNSSGGGAGFSRPRPESSGGGSAPRATAPPSGSRSEPQRERAQPREHARPRRPEN